MNSRNHIMQGAVGAWLFTDVLGLSQVPGTFGYAHALIWPRVTVHPSLPSAQGAFDSIRGRFSIAWENATTSFTLTAAVPTNTLAEVRLPFPAAAAATLTATEGGATFFKAGAFVPGVAGITGAAVDAATSTLVIDAGSGTFAFAVTW